MNNHRGELQLELRDGVVPMPFSGDQTTDPVPLDHLACALGSCLLSFADRFLERRSQPRRARMILTWELDPRRCRLDRMAAHLELAHHLDAPEHRSLERMLHTCPVHRALEPGIAIELTVAGDIRHAEALPPVPD